MATRSLEDACRLAAARKLGAYDIRQASARSDALGIGNILAEWPKMEVPASAVAADIHEACFLCFISLKAGTLTLDKTVGNLGLVHRLAHAAARDPSITPAERQAILEQAASIEGRVPGWPAVSHSLDSR